MKNNVTVYEAKNTGELAELLELDPADAIEIDLRVKLNKKILETVAKRGLTHAEVARRAGASRTRITAILNGNTSGVSTDLLLRILYSLGFKARVSFEQTTAI